MGAAELPPLMWPPCARLVREARARPRQVAHNIRAVKVSRIPPANVATSISGRPIPSGIVGAIPVTWPQRQVPRWPLISFDAQTSRLAMSRELGSSHTNQNVFYVRTTDRATSQRLRPTDIKVRIAEL